jgi:hypothetical protein
LKPISGAKEGGGVSLAGSFGVCSADVRAPMTHTSRKVMKSAGRIQDRSLTRGSREAASPLLNLPIDIPSLVPYSRWLARHLPLEAVSFVRRTRLLDILARALI